MTGPGTWNPRLLESTVCGKTEMRRLEGRLPSRLQCSRAYARHSGHHHATSRPASSSCTRRATPWEDTSALSWNKQVGDVQATIVVACMRPLPATISGSTVPTTRAVPAVQSARHSTRPRGQAAVWNGWCPDHGLDDSPVRWNDLAVVATEQPLSPSSSQKSPSGKLERCVRVCVCLCDLWVRPLSECGWERSKCLSLSIYPCAPVDIYCVVCLPVLVALCLICESVISNVVLTKGWLHLHSPSFVRSFVRSFVWLLGCLVVWLFGCLFGCCLLACSFVRSFDHPFVRSFVRSLVRSAAQPSTGPSTARSILNVDNSTPRVRECAYSQSCRHQHRPCAREQCSTHAIRCGHFRHRTYAQSRERNQNRACH